MSETISKAEHFCFTDRELSWLEFNLRVLREAGSESVPLAERVKFLSIYLSNLDEFFMVRVGTLIHRAKYEPDSTDEKTGWTPDTQIKKILSVVKKQQSKAEDIYRKLTKDLAGAGVDILDFNKISKVDESMAKKFFSEIKPLLSPTVTPLSQPLPFLQNGQPYVALLLEKGDKSFVATVSLSRIPEIFSYEVNGRTKIFSSPEFVAHFAAQLFKKYDIKEIGVIKVTRNADVYFNDAFAEDDYRSGMEKLLRKRKREQPVRLTFFGKPSSKLTDAFAEKLRVSGKYVFSTTLPSLPNFGSVIAKKPGFSFSDRKPFRNVLLEKGQLFKYLEKNDLLLSFPYQSINPFIDLIYEAADDPEVTSVKITLYRLAAPSKLAAALCYAADRGKDVLCLLELRARFDEQNNIDYSEMLESAGCRVIYGLPEMKVHSKVCLITRSTQKGTKYITQIGTGNYNEVTSEQYTDLSLITSEHEIGTDTESFFEDLEAGSAPAVHKHLITAPHGFKPWLMNMLDGQIAKGTEGRVTIKVNSMNDIDIMNKLIACSRAGVKVELFIRGICCLRPGISGFTDNITVKSVVGRHLEHSRIYLFGSGNDAKVFIGSGDLLRRNTTWRVEAFAEVKAPQIKKQIFEILDTFRIDNEKGSLMLPDGKYSRTEEPGTASQDAQYEYFSMQTIGAGASKKRRGFLSRLFGRK